MHIGPSNAEYCYVVIIPQSGTAHQALDLKYYRRRNFESTPMQDYEVRDVMNRRKDPQLVVKMHMRLDPDDHWYFTVAATNVSSVIARYVQIVVDLPPLLNWHPLIGAVPGGGRLAIRDEGVLSFRIKLRNKADQPVFAGDTKIWELMLEQSPSYGLPGSFVGQNPLQTFRYRAFADQMKVIEAEIDPAEVIELPPDGRLTIDVLMNQSNVRFS